MSSRVSIPIASRLMGSALTTSTFTLAGWPSWSNESGGRHGKRATLLSCSCRTRSESVRRDPHSDQARVSLAVDLHRDCSRRSRRAEARLHLRSSGASTVIQRFRCLLSSLVAKTVPRPVAHANRRRLTPPSGPSDACQPTLTRPTRMPVRCLPVTRRPARVASPGSSRVVDLPALFHAGSSMGTHPSEVSPRSRRTTLSGPAVLLAVFSRSIRRSVCSTRFVAKVPPKRALSREITLRCRGFEDLSHQRTSRLAASGLAASGCVHHRRRCSRLRRVAPLLVVPPLRG
jgi:hypothetical protein